MRILLDWQLGTNFGWGIAGLNLFRYLSEFSDLDLLMGKVITEKDILGLNPLSRTMLMPAMLASNQFWQQRVTAATLSTDFPGIVIHALGNDLLSGALQGQFNVARVVNEDTTLPAVRDRLRRYDAITAVSRWNAQLLSQATGRQVQVINEGVDTALFFPGPPSDMIDRSKFYIFTGGKIEYRKGQDLTLAAFKIFAQRHPDAVLVTAWHSPWPQISAGFQGQLSQPLRLDDRGQLDVMRWVHDNGINPQQVIDIGPVTHAQMPEIYRNVDVTLQPARAEAGTSFPVKEAMACGIPVIAAQNTGMLDLLTTSNSLPLTRQQALSGADKIGWGESDVEEIVESLEWVYQHRDDARELGKQAAYWIRDNKRTWREHSASLVEWLQHIL